MSYAGSVADMIQKIRMNRDLQIKNRNRLSKIGLEGSRSVYGNGQFNWEKFPKRSKEEIEFALLQVRLQLRKERSLDACKILCLLLACCIVFFILN